MLNKLWIHIFPVLLTLVFQTAIFPVQSSSQTAYKEFCDSLLLGKNMSITINSKKGNILILHWDKSMVWVKVSMSFYNPEPVIAQEELKYARFNFLKTNSGVIINNYFSLPEGTRKIGSVVTINYRIYVPDRITLVINNEYGSCHITNLNALMNINNRYGDINLERIRGHLRVYSTLCDIQVNDLQGIAEFHATSSNFRLRNINGNVFVENNVGTMHFEPGKDLIQLKVTSSHSPIDISVKDLNRFNYNLTAKKAEIDLGENFKRFPFQQKSKEKVFYHSKETKNIIEILANYNSIKLH